MSDQAMLPCAICGKKLENVFDDSVNQPYAGTTFATEGHYGSTAFDPMNGEYLEVNFCDSCLKEIARQGRVAIARSRKPVHFFGSHVGWAIGKRDPVHWRPEMEDLDDFLEIGSWEEWESLRESQKLSTWLGEENLREMMERNRLRPV